MTWFTSVLPGAVAVVVAVCGTLASDELPRRGVLGIQVAPGATHGVSVAGVLPEGNAKRAGLAPGDTIVSFAGEDVGDLQELGRIAQGIRAGDRVPLVVRRGAERVAMELEMTEPARTTVRGSEVDYGHVTLADGVRLRSILSVPEGAQDPAPVVYLLQGIPCSSIELPGSGPHPIRAQLDAFADAGLATYRVDKPGAGDSEGGPCGELGFDREYEGYLAGLDALLADPRIDPDRVYIYGISMGGIMAPLLASQRELAGVAVWGTGISNWMEYMIDNRREQALLFGQDRAAIESTTPVFMSFLGGLCLEGRTPASMLGEHPEFGPMLGITEGTTGYAGRHAEFHHELTMRDMFGAWAGVEEPTLVMHGEYDWVAFESESELIVSFVNERRGGNAELVSVPQMDHGFTTHPDLKASLANAFQGEWDDTVATIVVGWIKDL